MVGGGVRPRGEDRVFVRRGQGGQLVRFQGSGRAVHPRVRVKMRDILDSEERYRYADDATARLLSGARRTARAAGALDPSLGELDRNRTAWMTWTGTNVQDTLVGMFACRGVDVADQEIALIFDASVQDTATHLQAMVANPPTVSEIGRALPARRRGKYDAFVDPETVAMGLERDAVELEMAMTLLRKLF